MPSLANTQIIALLKSGEAVEDIARNLELPVSEVAAIAGTASLAYPSTLGSSADKEVNEEFSLAQFAKQHQKEMAENMLLLAQASENDSVRFNATRFIIDEAHGRNSKQSINVILGQNVSTINSAYNQLRQRLSASLAEGGNPPVIDVASS